MTDAEIEAMMRHARKEAIRDCINAARGANNRRLVGRRESMIIQSITSALEDILKEADHE